MPRICRGPQRLGTGNTEGMVVWTVLEPMYTCRCDKCCKMCWSWPLWLIFDSLGASVMHDMCAGAGVLATERAMPPIGDKKGLDHGHHRAPMHVAISQKLRYKYCECGVHLQPRTSTREPAAALIDMDTRFEALS
jgi:hypothetical protein